MKRKIFTTLCLALCSFAVCKANASNNMVYVEGGTFQRNSTNQVTVSSFYMSKYEVTQGEWEAVMGDIRKEEEEWDLYAYGIGDNYPMYLVTWYDAVKYCNRRSEAEKLTPCYTIDGTNVTCNWSANGYRLPTEAEWEYAARGGKHKSTYRYSGSDNIDEVAWQSENSGNGLNEDDPDYGTHEVGTKKANALGIYDMSGNVREWCWDWYDLHDGTEETSSLNYGRVVRGGDWGRGYFNAVYCRCAYRDSYTPGGRSNTLGFRVVRSAK